MAHATAFLRDGSLITASSPNLRRWDWSGKGYSQPPDATGHKARVTGLLFNPRTDSLLTAGGDSLREWKLADWSSGTPLKDTQLPYEGISKMWLWPRGKGFLLSRRIDGNSVIQGVRRSGNKMLSRFKIDFGSDETNSAWCSALHPTNAVLATGHHNSKIRLWDIGSSKPKEIADWVAHQGHVCELAFSPDGRRLGSAGWDNKTKLWSLPQSLMRLSHAVAPPLEPPPVSASALEKCAGPVTGIGCKVDAPLRIAVVFLKERKRESALG